MLRAEQQDHLPLLSTEAGIKVMVHKRDHTPFLEHRGFSIRPGTETTIGIREVRRGPAPGSEREGGWEELTPPPPQDEVHRLGSPYGRCTDSAEGVDVRMLYNATYTMQVRPAGAAGVGKGRGRGPAGGGGRQSCPGPPAPRPCCPRRPAWSPASSA